MIERMGNTGLGIELESTVWMRQVNKKLDEIISEVNKNDLKIELYALIEKWRKESLELQRSYEKQSQGTFKADFCSSVSSSLEKCGSDLSTLLGKYETPQ